MIDPERAATKTCTRCSKSLPVSEFGVHRAAKSGLRPACRECHKADQRARYSKMTREQKWKVSGGPAQRSKLMKSYGITPEYYDRMIYLQEGQCGICRKVPEEGERRLAVDHCHETGRVRGLLCFGCNAAIGRLGDDLPSVLRAVLRELGYTEVHAVNFGSSPLGGGPTGDDLYANRRAEMWDLMRDWFNDAAGVQIPDADAVHGDLTAPVWGKGATHHRSNNELVLESKDSIRERLKFSPDLGDAMALTFAQPIRTAHWDDDEDDRRGRNSFTGY